MLGKYTLAKKRIGFDKMANGGEKGRTFRWGEGDDALGAFVQVIERALANVNYARAYVLPAPVYYQPTPNRPSGA